MGDGTLQGLGPPRLCVCAQHCASVTSPLGGTSHLCGPGPAPSAPSPKAGHPLSPGWPLGRCPAACTHHPPKSWLGPSPGLDGWADAAPPVGPLPSTFLWSPVDSAHTPWPCPKAQPGPEGLSLPTPLSTSWLHETLRSRSDRLVH